jgi:hypothetical protein
MRYVRFGRTVAAELYAVPSVAIFALNVHSRPPTER